ncbi:MAG: hypothetical protein HOE90_20640 [Bacteriovoracaceae bacterium]|jgi:hypothetical protein|nr:hypothetical protein [Bacteriovoracaceae bacterium]
MKPILKLNKNAQILFYSLFTLLSLFLAAGGFFYWKAGLMDGSRTSSLYEAATRIEDLVNNKRIQTVGSLVRDGKVRASVTMYEAIEKKIRKVNRVFSTTEEYEALEEVSYKMKKELASLLSQPDVIPVFKVLRSKFSQFNTFVEKNKWKTLSRISGRVVQKMNTNSKITSIFLRQIYRSAKQDVTIMRQVSESSVLTKTDKTLITARLNSLQNELSTVAKYLTTQKRFLKYLNNFSKKFDFWIKKVGPGLAAEQIRVEKNAKYFAFGIISVFCFILVSLFGSKIIFNKLIKNESRQLEINFLNLLKHGMIAETSPRIPFDFSDEFLKAFEANREYVHRRMKYSGYFQTAFPFASILLDTNLKVVWANETFCDSWKIDPSEIKGNKITWDYLNRFTNLGGDDPVFESFEKDIPGIYQVQVRIDDTKARIPYEMYVSPVGSADDKKLMVFFYPLISLEETIENQAKSLVSPVAKALDALMVGSFNKEKREKLRSEFEIAGIQHVFEKFNGYHESNQLQKQGLLTEIDDLEKTISDQHKVLSDVHQVHGEVLTRTKEFKDHLNNTRDGVIGLSDTNICIDDVAYNSLNKFKEVLDKYTKTQGAGKAISERLAQSSEIADGVGTFKMEFKKIRDNMSSAKMRLLQAIDQALVFQRSNDFEPHQLEHTFNRIKTMAKDLDQLVCTFEKQLVQFDVQMTKLRMVLESHDEMGTNFSENLEAVYKYHSGLEADRRNLSGETKYFEDRLVLLMNNMFEFYKEVRSNVHFSAKLAEESLQYNEILQVVKEEKGQTAVKIERQGLAEKIPTV